MNGSHHGGVDSGRENSTIAARCYPPISTLCVSFFSFFLVRSLESSTISEFVIEHRLTILNGNDERKNERDIERERESRESIEHKKKEHTSLIDINSLTQQSAFARNGRLAPPYGMIITYQK